MAEFGKVPFRLAGGATQLQVTNVTQNESLRCEGRGCLQYNVCALPLQSVASQCGISTLASVEKGY